MVVMNLRRELTPFDDFVAAVKAPCSNCGAEANRRFGAPRYEFQSGSPVVWVALPPCEACGREITFDVVMPKGTTRLP